MFVTIDQASKFACVELHEKAKNATARDFLLWLLDAVQDLVRELIGHPRRIKAERFEQAEGRTDCSDTVGRTLA